MSAERSPSIRRRARIRSRYWPRSLRICAREREHQQAAGDRAERRRRHGAGSRAAPCARRSARGSRPSSRAGASWRPRAGPSRRPDRPADSRSRRRRRRSRPARAAPRRASGSAQSSDERAHELVGALDVGVGRDLDVDEAELAHVLGAREVGHLEHRIEGDVEVLHLRRPVLRVALGGAGGDAVDEMHGAVPGLEARR